MTQQRRIARIDPCRTRDMTIEEGDVGEFQIWADGEAGEVIGCDTWGIGTILACDWFGGRVLAFGPGTDGHPTTWGDGYDRPEGIYVLDDEALITEQSGTLLRQDLNIPGRANASVIASGLGAPHQVLRTRDGSAALLTDYAGGRVLRVDLSNGVVDEVATGLGNPVGIAIGSADELFVTEQAGGYLTRIDTDGTTTTLLTGLVAPFFLRWTSDARTTLLVTERAPANRVGVVDLTVNSPILQRLLGRSIEQPSDVVLAEGRLIVTGSDRLLSLDATDGLKPVVTLAMPTSTQWPGSWFDIHVNTGVTGYRRAELVITTEPSSVATLSEHPGSDDDPTQPTVRLLAGGAPGTADVVVRDAVTGEELAREPVEIGIGDVELDGPPMWVDEPVAAPPPLHFLADVKNRGVDDTGSLKPVDRDGNALTAWRVLAVLVDTGTATWPAADVAAAQAQWRTTLTGAGGVNAFYQEMSADRFGIDLVGGAVIAPVHLGKTWEDWFEKEKSTSRWRARPAVLDTVVGSLQLQGIDWLAIDAVFMVVRSADTTRFVWPNSTVGRTETEVVVADFPLAIRFIALARTVMPHDQSTLAAGPGKKDVVVSSHELGHTLGLDDLYMKNPPYVAGMVARAIDTRELMGQDTELPHLCARHKLLLGFLDQSHVRSFDYGTREEAVIDLFPIAGGLPPAGPNNAAAIELKVAPKLSWFFEFRQPVSGKLGDRGITSRGEIVGYDAVTYEDPPVVANERRPIILLLNDDDAEGPILHSIGEDYEDLNTDNPGVPTTFRLELMDLKVGKATVKVAVQPVGKPDPAITNNPGNGNFKSPDIEIRNDFTDANPDWPKVAMLDMPNRVVAKVHNVGSLDAPTVTVRLSLMPFNTDDPGSSRWIPLGEPVVHDIPAGKTVEFEADWTPTDYGHYCIQARIDRYVRVPGAAADEPDVDNNLAQSNFTFLFSFAFSPASREVSVVEVHNPYAYPTNAVIELRQDFPGYRSYVDHRWLRLKPGQTRTVEVEVESKATSVLDVIERHQPDGRTWIRSWLDTEEYGHTRRTGTGVTVNVATAVATQIGPVELGEGLLLVGVTSPAAGAPPPHDGTVAARVSYVDGQTEVLTASVGAHGHAQLHPRFVSGTAELYFSGTAGYGPSKGEAEIFGRN